MFRAQSSAGPRCEQTAKKRLSEMLPIASSLPPQKRTSARPAGSSAVRLHHFRKNTEEDHGKSWHECDLRAAPINVRSWESNGLNADDAFGPYGQFCCDAHNMTFLPTTMW